MVQNRNIAVCIILSIVTCGIYGLYWQICIVNDLNYASGHSSDTSGGAVLLLSIITCNIYNLYWLYTAGSKVDEIRASRGLPASGSGIAYLLLSLFGFSIISWALIQNELNDLSAPMTR